MSVRIERYTGDEKPKRSYLPPRKRREMSLGEDMQLVFSDIPDKKGDSEVFIWKYDSRNHPEGPDDSCQFLGHVPRKESLEIPGPGEIRVIVRNT